jgi:pimeloyl-ACP methyl ester carboxylesterase
LKKLFFLNTLWLINACSQNTTFESIVKNDQFRSEIINTAAGHFVALNEGFTYYLEENPTSEIGTVVLVHGFSVPSYIWEMTFETLKNNGYHVVALDLYGRGYSDNPDRDYTDALMANQVLELMSHLRISKAHLVGLSNGGRIISQTAALKPSMVQSLIYVSSNSFEDIQASTDVSVSEAEIASMIIDYPELAAGQNEDFFDPNQFPDWSTKYAQLQQYKGFAKALISTRKNHTNMDDIHLMIHDTGIPVFTLWGVSDKVVVYDEFKEKLPMLLPNRKEFFIKSSGHLPQMENRKDFENILIKEILEIFR